jgi:signal peptidase I
VLTALLLAFVFRTFFVEPFMIPTGSMAPALLGAHARVLCQSCGFEYPVSASAPTGGRASDRPAAEGVCPLCRGVTAVGPSADGSGDRILVHKWPFDLGGWFGPRRWDVIVFRDPAEPEQNYIKRLVGLPGEQIEIVAGDVFINGHVARKPPHVQQVLWLPVYSQEHCPRARTLAVPHWDAAVGTGWSGLEQRVLLFRAAQEAPDPLILDPGVARAAFLDMNGYNRRSSGDLVADLRCSAELHLLEGAPTCTIVLTINDDEFIAEFSASGQVRLLHSRPQAPPRLLAAAELPPPPPGRGIPLEFGRLDGRLAIRVGGKTVAASPESEYLPDDLELRRTGLNAVGLLLEGVGPGAFSLHRFRVDRDVHYTLHPSRSQRAFPGQPFALRAGEHFVLGDNSPDSRDSREWTEGSPRLPHEYRPGTVLTDQIVGLGAFVYLPSLLPSGLGALRVIPDLGRTRFIR